MGRQAACLAWEPGQRKSGSAPSQKQEPTNLQHRALWVLNPSENPISLEAHTESASRKQGPSSVAWDVPYPAPTWPQRRREAFSEPPIKPTTHSVLEVVRMDLVPGQRRQQPSPGTLLSGIATGSGDTPKPCKQALKHIPPPAGREGGTLWGPQLLAGPTPLKPGRGDPGTGAKVAALVDPHQAWRVLSGRWGSSTMSSSLPWAASGPQAARAATRPRLQAHRASAPSRRIGSASYGPP